MSTEFGLSDHDSMLATRNGIVFKNKVRHTAPVPDPVPTETSEAEGEDEDFGDFSEGLSGSEEDEILQSEDDVEKFISKRQMSYPPLPRYESPITTLSSNSKEKLGILTPPIEERSGCNSAIKSERSSSRDSIPRSRHVSFSTTDADGGNGGQEMSRVNGVSSQRLRSPVESNMSISPSPAAKNGKTSEEDEEEESEEENPRKGRKPVQEEIMGRSKSWETSREANLPVADLVLEGLIVNFQKIQDIEALLLFTSEFGSHLKKVQPETIVHNFKDICEILAALSSSSNFRLNIEAFNGINSFSERLRHLTTKSLQGQFPNEATEDLTPLVKQLCSTCAESKSVLRHEAGATFSKLIRGGGPRLITESLFRIMNQTAKCSPKVKATALDALTLLLLTFPRDNFQLDHVAKEVCSILLSPKRRLRLAALECLAVVAHALGPSFAMPLFRQLIEQEISNGIRSSTLPRRNNVGGQSSASKAVSARVSRRVLPSMAHNGLINYAMIPLPTSTNRALYKTVQYEEERDTELDLDEYGFLEPIMNAVGKKYGGHHLGADILYVLRGSGAGANLNIKSPTRGSPSSSSSDGNGHGHGRPELMKSGRLSTRDPDIHRHRQMNHAQAEAVEAEVEEEEEDEEDVEIEAPTENRREGTPYTGLSRVSPFNGPNVIKQEEELTPQFIEQGAPAPEFRYRYSSNDLRTPKPVEYEYVRRGSEGYNTNGNVRKSTPYLNPNNTAEYTVMTLEHNINIPSHLGYATTKYMNGNHHHHRSTMSDEEDGTGHENGFVGESEDVESKKSSAGSSTRDSGVSSLKSAGRMLPNGSPPSTGEQAEEEDELDEVEIPELEGENEDEVEVVTTVTPKRTPVSSRGSESQRTTTATASQNQGTDEEIIGEPGAPARSSQFRPVQNSPPPTPRLVKSGDGSDFILRKPATVRTSSKSKLGVVKFCAAPPGDDVDEEENNANYERRVKTSPTPYRRSPTPRPPVKNSYRASPTLTAGDQNGHVHNYESTNGHGHAEYRTPIPKTPAPDFPDDFEDEEIEETEATDSSRNSRESASSNEQERIKPCPAKKFLRKGLTTVIPPAATTRRVYKGSFRESNSQSRVQRGTTPTEVYPQDMKPLDSPKHGLSQGLQKLTSTEWEANVEGFRLIVRLIRHNQEYLVRANSPDLHNIIMSGLRQLGNLRSQVCRAACLFFKEMFTHLDTQSPNKTVEQDLDKISEKLLDKSVDTNRFIREDSASALDAMVLAMPPNKCINALDLYGTKHHNAIVRKSTARLLDLIVKRLGAERVLMEYPDKALPMLVRFLQEGNLETRTHAKSALGFLALNPSFDAQLRRTVPPDLLRHADKAIITLKNELKFGTRNATRRL